MDNQIEEVKSRTDIVALVGNYVALKKAGRNYRGLCPFHSEKTPSFMVSADRQIFKCFGCNEGGDSLTFYQKIEGVEFGEALKALAARSGVILKDYKPSPVEKQKETLVEINSLAAQFYNYILTEHVSGKKALNYLKERNLNDKSIADWQLGFAPNNWDSLFKFLQKKKFDIKDMILSGVLVPSSGRGGYDRFRSRVMFPIRNVTGQVIGFSGRVFGEGEPKYLNSPDSLLFNKSQNLYGLDRAKNEIKKQNLAVLVEGNLDMISSHQVGVTNVIAPLGTALTEKQLELIRRFSENLLISFDKDTAGESAAKRAIVMAEKLGMNVKLTTIAGKDPDEVIRENPDNWKKAISESVSVYDYFIDSSVKKFGFNDNGSIRKVTSEIIPLLRTIGNEITRSHYERILASKLGVSEGSVKAEIAKLSSQNFASEKPAVVSKINLTEDERLEKYLLSLVLQNQFLPKELAAGDFNQPEFRIILEIILNNSQERKFKANAIEKLIPSELQSAFNQLSLSEIDQDLAENQDKVEQEMNTCLLRLKELNLRTRLQKLTLAIKQAEISGSQEQVSSLTNNFKDLSKELSQVEKSRES